MNKLTHSLSHKGSLYAEIQATHSPGSDSAQFQRENLQSLLQQGKAQTYFV